jgi:hypothetical protein
MSRRPARATQADISRALRAGAQAGAQIAVEIMPDGRIRIVPMPPGEEKNTLELERDIVL